MGLHEALTELSELSVSGVIRNYNYDEIPTKLIGDGLPALIVLPVEALSDQRKFFGLTRGSGFESVPFDAGNKTVTFFVTHLLLTSNVSGQFDISRHMVELVTSIDNYFTALAADPTLGDTLAEPAKVTIELGAWNYERLQFYGASLRHKWIIAL